jgi:rhamnosyltransferase
MKILIILASFNGVKYIKQQIDSILSQEGVNIDIKIFDDGSSDGTVELISSLYSSERIQIIQNEIPTGSSANNFFQALQQIEEIYFEKYNYIAFADQDDIWLPNKLKEAVVILDTQEADLYMSNLILWQEKSNRKSIVNKSFSQKKYDYLFEGGSAGCTYVLSAKFVSKLKEIIKNTDNLYWKYFSHDWFIYFVARTNNFKVTIDNRAFILYRIHETNIHGQLNILSIFAIKERLKLVANGWYYHHAKGFINFLPLNSKEIKIYKWYTKNYFTRLYVLFRYNFSLIRSTKKAFQFFLVSLIPLKNNN